MYVSRLSTRPRGTGPGDTGVCKVTGGSVARTPRYLIEAPPNEFAMNAPYRCPRPIPSQHPPEAVGRNQRSRKERGRPGPGCRALALVHISHHAGPAEEGPEDGYDEQ